MSAAGRPDPCLAAGKILLFSFYGLIYFPPLAASRWKTWNSILPDDGANVPRMARPLRPSFILIGSRVFSLQYSCRQVCKIYHFCFVRNYFLFMSHVHIRTLYYCKFAVIIAIPLLHNDMVFLVSGFGFRVHTPHSLGNSCRASETVPITQEGEREGENRAVRAKKRPF